MTFIFQKKVMEITDSFKSTFSYLLSLVTFDSCYLLAKNIYQLLVLYLYVVLSHKYSQSCESSCEGDVLKIMLEWIHNATSNFDIAAFDLLNCFHSCAFFFNRIHKTYFSYFTTLRISKILPIYVVTTIFFVRARKQSSI